MKKIIKTILAIIALAFPFILLLISLCGELGWKGLVIFFGLMAGLGLMVGLMVWGEIWLINEYDL